MANEQPATRSLDEVAELLAAILLAQIEEKYKRKKNSSVDSRKSLEKELV